jgi:hypothetical protein
LGPIPHRGQQEAGDDGHAVTVNHFVRVPLRRR